MWNGFWKMTAMVAVIGVGLVAVYSAQQGMNPLIPAKSNPAEDRVTVDDVETPIDDVPQREPPTEELADIEPINVEKKTGETARKGKASTSVNFEIESSTEQPPERGSAKKPSLAKKNSPQLASTRQNPKGAPVETSASSDDEILEFANHSNAASEERHTAGEREADKPGGRKGTAVRPAVVEEPEIILETTDSTIDETTAVAKDEQDAPATDARLTAEPFEPSNKSIEAVTTDSESAPPPRSKRAMQKSGTSSEATEAVTEVAPPVEEIQLTGTKTDEEETPPNETTSQGKTSEETVFDLESPEKPDTSPPAELSLDPLPQTTAPRTLPRDLPTNSDDNPQPVPIKSGTRPSRRARSLIDLDSDLTNTPSQKGRDSGTLRRDSELQPADMVGDGIVGDPSQRGLQQPRITIEKKAQPQAILGQPLIYAILVKNTGTVDAHNLVIEDRIPKGAELQGTDPRAELSGRRLIWNQPLLRPNEEKKISIKVIPTQEGPIGSVARVYFATEVTAEIVVSAPQLEFTVKAPAQVRLGQKFDLIYNLKNIGKVEAVNVVVRDLVPEELKTEAGNDIECMIGKLAPDEVREVVLTATAEKTGSILNKAILTADSGINKTLNSQIDIVGEVLVLTRSGQNKLYVERPAVFANNVRNEGNQRAEKIQISEVVPAGMQFSTASDGGRYDPQLNAVLWTIGPIAPGADKTVNVKYVPKERGTFDAKVTAVGAAGSTAAVNSSVDVVGKPELQMDTQSATGSMTVGEQITSKIQLNNTGTAAANNVQLRIRLPRELRLISVKGAKYKRMDDNTIIFESIPEFAPRTKVAYELILEPIDEADAQIGLEIAADHLAKPGRRVESIQIARDPLK